MKLNTQIVTSKGAQDKMIRLLSSSKDTYITDKITNKKLLFLGRRPHAYIVGLELEESEDLLNEIWEHATDEKFTWTQNWEKGDLLMWKNLNVLHKRDAFDPNTRRVMHRTQIKGEMAITA